MTNKTITLTTQEIFDDIWKLAELEGYLSGLAEGVILEEKDKKDYYNDVKDMIMKYIPNYISFTSDEYETNDLYEKGLELSSMLYDNFKEIINQLV